jgi:hypothetical protein
MKVVIVGAGASFDSIDATGAKDHVWCPPIGKELFKYSKEYNAILENYPGAESFRSAINQSRDIEEFFQTKDDLSGLPGGANTKMQLINTQFYLQELFHKISSNYTDFGTSNYESLASLALDFHIKHSQEAIVFISFNYDTLLERALSKVWRVRFDKIDDYIDGPVKVIKPHGSCNWFRYFNKSKSNPVSGIKQKDLPKALYHDFGNAIYVMNSLSEQIIIKNEPIHNDVVNEASYVPQIIIPLQKKDPFICPGEHIDILSSVLKKASELLIIGWKGNERSFHQKLKNALGPIPVTIVSKGDKQVISNLNDIIGLQFNLFGGGIVKDGRPDDLGTFSAYMRESMKNNELNFFK